MLTMSKLPARMESELMTRKKLARSPPSPSRADAFAWITEKCDSPGAFPFSNPCTAPATASDAWTPSTGPPALLMNSVFTAVGPAPSSWRASSMSVSSVPSERADRLA